MTAVSGLLVWFKQFIQASGAIAFEIYRYVAKAGRFDGLHDVINSGLLEQAHKVLARNLDPSYFTVMSHATIPFRLLLLAAGQGL